MLTNSFPEDSVFPLFFLVIFLITFKIFTFLPLLPVLILILVQFSSVTQSCPTLRDPTDCSTSGFPVHHQVPEFTQTHVHQVGDAIQSSHPLSFPPSPTSIFPSIRVFSTESILSIRWLKFWSFSFSICPSNEYSGLISLRIHLISLQSKGLSRVFSNTAVQKHQFFTIQLSL